MSSSPKEIHGPSPPPLPPRKLSAPPPLPPRNSRLPPLPPRPLRLIGPVQGQISALAPTGSEKSSARSEHESPFWSETGSVDIGFAKGTDDGVAKWRDLGPSNEWRPKTASSVTPSVAASSNSHTLRHRKSAKVVVGGAAVALGLYALSKVVTRKRTPAISDRVSLLSGHSAFCTTEQPALVSMSHFDEAADQLSSNAENKEVILIPGAIDHPRESTTNLLSSAVSIPNKDFVRSEHIWDDNRDAFLEAESSGTGFLCETCRELNVVEWFSDFPRLPGHSGSFTRSEKVITHSPVSEILQNQTCPFCRLCASILKARAGHIKYDYLAGAVCKLFQVHIDDCLVPNRMVARKALSFLVVRAVRDDALENNVMNLRQLNSFETNLMAPSYMAIHCPEQGQEFSRGRVIPKTEVDWHRIQAWLARCTRDHGYHCSNQTGEIVQRPLRLVDVVDECVVNTPPDAQWITLSYVWGDPKAIKAVAATQEFLSQPRSLSRMTLPRTILDAITATEKLGQRYLWIDVLCISQQDVVEKRAEIMKLSGIFSQSILTLAALDGWSADGGLPGVRPGSRCIPQWFARVNDKILMTRQPDYDIVSPVGGWITRAWTYQEGILATRCLFFSDAQIYFNCQCERWSEDVSLELPFMFSKLSYRFKTPVALNTECTRFQARESFDFEPRQDNDNLLTCYQQALGQFITRKFSYESDILAAFSGTASLLTARFGGSSICGLPTSDFHILLCWSLSSGRVSNPVYRRAGDFEHFSTFTGLQDTGPVRLPSWCWAAWSDAAGYSELKGYVEECETVVSISCCHSEAPDKLAVVQTSLVRGKDSIWKKLTMSLSGSTMTEQIVQCVRGKNLNTVLLVFWGDVASLADVKSVYIDTYTDHNLPWWANLSDLRSQYFVPVIRQFNHHDDGSTISASEEPFDRTWALLIGWKGGIADRRGFCGIHWEVWRKSRTQRRLVILA